MVWWAGGLVDWWTGGLVDWKRDLILDASTCLAYGLVDCIIDSQHTPYFVEGDLLD